MKFLKRAKTIAPNMHPDEGITRGLHSAKSAILAYRRAVVVALVILTLAATACYNNNTGRVDIGGEINFKLPAFPESGGHAVEIFTEMHFQPSYKVQEGPRMLPPEDSVPVSGKEIVPASLDEYGQLEFPADVAQAYDDSEAGGLYTVNCLVCHGASLTGDGPITTMVGADGDLAYDTGPFPADLTAEATKNSTDGEIFGFVSGGGRQGLSARLRGRESTSPMPEFRRLLTEEERWMLVQFLRSRIGR